MRLISSRTTFFYKRILPVLFFGILALASIVALKDGVGDGGPVVLTMLGAIAVVGYVNMRFFLFNSLDQVFEDGDALVLKNAGKEERVALSDIASVSSSTFVNPPRVVLAFRRPTVFGNKVAFIVPIPGLPFVKSEIVTGLIERVDRARRR